MLPVVLDVGTNNKELQNDPEYLGVPEDRLDSDDYFDMVDEFMQAVFQRWPGVVVQFEDFLPAPKAVPLLEKYRHRYRCFNDDIQGTGSPLRACFPRREMLDLRSPICASSALARRRWAWCLPTDC